MTAGWGASPEIRGEREREGGGRLEKFVETKKFCLLSRKNSASKEGGENMTQVVCCGEQVTSVGEKHDACAPAKKG